VASEVSSVLARCLRGDVEAVGGVSLAGSTHPAAVRGESIGGPDLLERGCLHLLHARDREDRGGAQSCQGRPQKAAAIETRSERGGRGGGRIVSPHAPPL